MRDAMLRLNLVLYISGLQIRLHHLRRLRVRAEDGRCSNSLTRATSPFHRLRATKSIALHGPMMPIAPVTNVVMYKAHVWARDRNQSRHADLCERREEAACVRARGLAGWIARDGIYRMREGFGSLRE
jgi:hypothetical protein